MVGFDKLIIDKWTPLVDKHLNIKNTYFRFLCCHYFHYLKSHKGDISVDILDFKEKISKLDVFKVEIKKEYINLLTGQKEYLLKNGKIFSNNSFDFCLTTDELILIFGIEFITYLNPTLSRDFKITKILDNDGNRE